MSLRGLFQNPPRPTPREELRREQRARAAKGLQEIDRSGLTRQPFGLIVDADGGKWRVARGEIADARYVAATAYYVVEGEIVFLEPLR